MKGFVLDDRKPEDDLIDELAHLMVWHTDIRNRNPFGYRFEPISFPGIRGYEPFLAKLGLEMTAFDEDMLYRLDAVWMESQPDPAGSKPGKRR